MRTTLGLPEAGSCGDDLALEDRSRKNPVMRARTRSRRVVFSIANQRGLFITYDDSTDFVTDLDGSELGWGPSPGILCCRSPGRQPSWQLTFTILLLVRDLRA